MAGTSFTPNALLAGKKYYYAGSTRVAVRTGTADPLWLLGDHLGSTSRTANYDGSPYANGWQLYKPWGEKRYPSGASGLPTTYRYTGQRQDSYINLYWYGSRWYDDSLGRFIQPDSIVPESSQGTQAWDRFAYVNNNPVRFRDSTGHSAYEYGYWPGETPQTPFPKANYECSVSANLLDTSQYSKLEEGATYYTQAPLPNGTVTWSGFNANEVGSKNPLMIIATVANIIAPFLPQSAPPQSNDLVANMFFSVDSASSFVPMNGPCSGSSITYEGLSIYNNSSSNVFLQTVGLNTSDDRQSQSYWNQKISPNSSVTLPVGLSTGEMDPSLPWSASSYTQFLVGGANDPYRYMQCEVWTNGDERP